MTLSYAGRLDRAAVMGAATLVHGLVARPEVAASWTRESSCAGMTVGGLTRHLVGQTTYVVSLVRAAREDTVEAPALTLLQHYTEAAWTREGLDGDSARFVRDKSATQALD